MSCDGDSAERDVPGSDPSHAAHADGSVRKTRRDRRKNGIWKKEYGDDERRREDRGGEKSLLLRRHDRG